MDEKLFTRQAKLSETLGDLVCGLESEIDRA